MELASTAPRKFVGGSDDPGERPPEVGDERLDQALQRPSDAAGLPSARVGRHLKHPDAGGDSPEARMGDRIVGLAGLYDDEVGAAADAEVFEPLIGGERLSYLSDVAVFGEDLGHRRRAAHAARLVATFVRKPLNVQRNGCAS